MIPLAHFSIKIHVNENKSRSSKVTACMTFVIYGYSNVYQMIKTKNKTDCKKKYINKKLITKRKEKKNIILHSRHQCVGKKQDNSTCKWQIKRNYNNQKTNKPCGLFVYIYYFFFGNDKICRL